MPRDLQLARRLRILVKEHQDPAVPEGAEDRRVHPVSGEDRSEHRPHPAVERCVFPRA